MLEEAALEQSIEHTRRSCQPAATHREPRLPRSVPVQHPIQQAIKDGPTLLQPALELCIQLSRLLRPLLGLLRLLRRRRADWEGKHLRPAAQVLLYRCGVADAVVHEQYKRHLQQ